MKILSVAHFLAFFWSPLLITERSSPYLATPPLHFLVVRPPVPDFSAFLALASARLASLALPPLGAFMTLLELDLGLNSALGATVRSVWRR